MVTRHWFHKKAKSLMQVNPLMIWINDENVEIEYFHENGNSGEVSFPLKTLEDFIAKHKENQPNGNSQAKREVV